MLLAVQFFVLCDGRFYRSLSTSFSIFIAIRLQNENLRRLAYIKQNAVIEAAASLMAEEWTRQPVADSRLGEQASDALSRSSARPSGPQRSRRRRAGVDRSSAGVRLRPAFAAACHPHRARARADPPATTKHNHPHRLLSFHRVFICRLLHRLGVL